MSARTSPAPVPLEPHWFQILLAVADRDLHGLAIMNDVLERTGGRMREDEADMQTLLPVEASAHAA